MRRARATVNQGALTRRFGSSGSNPISYTPAVFLTGYNFTSGATTWTDLSPNGRNATVENGVSTSNGVAKEVYFNGSTNWQFPNVSVGNAWTFVVWCKVSSLSANSAVLTQIISGTATGTNLTFGNTTGDTANLTTAFYSSSWRNGTNVPIASYPNMTCFTGTWDGTTLKTYVNGSLVGSATPGGTVVDSGSAYRIGRRWDAASYITGYVGEVRVYSQVLTPAEVLSDYNYVSTVRPYT